MILIYSVYSLTVLDFVYKTQNRSYRLNVMNCQKIVLITCKVKAGGATGDTDDSLITEGCNHPIGFFVCVWQVYISSGSSLQLELI